MAGAGPAPGAACCRSLREVSLRSRRRRRAVVPATAGPVVTRRHAAPGTAPARSAQADPSNGARRSFHRGRPPSRALPAVASAMAHNPRHPRLRPPPANPWHLSGWTEQTRGRAGRTQRARVDHAHALDLPLQLDRPRPSTSQSESDSAIESQLRSCAGTPPAMTFQPLRQVAGEPEVVPRPALVSTVEMQQVHNALSRHETKNDPTTLPDASSKICRQAAVDIVPARSPGPVLSSQPA